MQTLLLFCCFKTTREEGKEEEKFKNCRIAFKHRMIEILLSYQKFNSEKSAWRIAHVIPSPVSLLRSGASTICRVLLRRTCYAASVEANGSEDFQLKFNSKTQRYELKGLN